VRPGNVASRPGLYFTPDGDVDLRGPTFTFRIFRLYESGD
jgi:hypothetical protein